jgi:CysZ protein
MVYSKKSAQMANSGAGYFLLGFKLIQLKGIRRFVFVPLAINLTLFSIAFYYLFAQLDHYLLMLDNTLPDFLSWLSSLIKPFAIAGLLFLFSFIFSAVTNWLAAPFNGLLSEKLETMLSDYVYEDSGIRGIVSDVPRTLSREWQKFLYYFPRAIGYFIVFLILPIIGQIIWFLFVAWMMAIQYKDYPFDNHKIPFEHMRKVLNNNKGISYSFGITTAIFSMLPIINFIVMPVAICGATALWVDKYQEQMLHH